MKQGWATRRWFVTGTSSGFGREFVRAVVESGGTVFATTRDTADIADLVDCGDGRVQAIKLDVARREEIAAAVEAVNADGGIDVLVNNAGYGFTGGIEETSEAEIRALFETNFFGAAALTRMFLPLLRKRGGGFVVNISSIAAITGTAASGWYSASKAALDVMSEALSAEAADFGIRTLIVEPAAFHTDFAQRSRGHASAPLEIYPSVKAAKTYLDERAWANAYLPADGVRAVLSAMDAPDPPLRLLLGAHAVRVAETALQGRLDEARAWQHVSALDE